MFSTQGRWWPDVISKGLKRPWPYIIVDCNPHGLSLAWLHLLTKISFNRCSWHFQLPGISIVFLASLSELYMLPSPSHFGLSGLLKSRGKFLDSVILTFCMPVNPALHGWQWGLQSVWAIAKTPYIMAAADTKTLDDWTPTKQIIENRFPRSPHQSGDPAILFSNEVFTTLHT